MILAHTGHWYHSLLYLAPVLLIAAALWWSGRGDPGPEGDEHETDDLLGADDLLGPGGGEPGDPGRPGSDPGRPGAGELPDAGPGDTGR